MAKHQIKSNLLDIPMDCPQQDERLDYAGDTQMFKPIATFIKDLLLFYSKWLKDLEFEQTADFGVPMVVPNILEVQEHRWLA